MTNGEKLKKIRKEKDMTQRQLADKVGISLMSIQRYERDERQPTLEILQKICDALDVSVYDLIGLRETKGELVTKPKHEKDLYLAAKKNIPSYKFWNSKTEIDHKLKERLLNAITPIANMSKISLEKTFSLALYEELAPATDDSPAENYLIAGGEFNGVIITYKDKQFRISVDEYYKLADRIIESVAVNILAAETYKKE